MEVSVVDIDGGECVLKSEAGGERGVSMISPHANSMFCMYCIFMLFEPDSDSLDTQGRYLRAGDSLPVSKLTISSSSGFTLPAAFLPVYGNPTKGDIDNIISSNVHGSPPPAPSTSTSPNMPMTWTVGVLPGPHADPDYITEQWINEIFYSSTWRVHYQSNRLGVKLVGPKPEWVRTDGGEGGNHPSNVHDHIYAIGESGRGDTECHERRGEGRGGEGRGGEARTSVHSFHGIPFMSLLYLGAVNFTGDSPVSLKRMICVKGGPRSYIFFTRKNKQQFLVPI
jgi:hypothetical protein